MRRVMIVWIFLCMLGLLTAIGFGPQHVKLDKNHSEDTSVRMADVSRTSGEHTRRSAKDTGTRAAASVSLDRQSQVAASHTPTERLSHVKSSSQHISLTDGELDLLTHAVYGEARGEPYAGQVAVAAVILNRVEDPRFPDRVAEVIYEPGAFTAVADKQIYLVPDETAREAARDAAMGADPTGGAVYYYNPARTTNDWIWSREVITVIGRHWFAQ